MTPACGILELRRFASRSMRVLIVEDEKKLASFVAQALAEEGYAVDIALNGSEGFSFALGAEFDLIVLDHLLPGMSGREICGVLRGCGSAVPILMLTARDTLEDKVASLDAGADDYLTKPFALEELLARVRALLRRSGQSVAPVLSVDDLTLDPQARVVRRGSRQIDLTAREYALLEYLMRNAGRPITRSMIAEHVWGFDFDTETNVIDVYINYLRNKIDRGASHPLIRTLRGVGYRIG